MSEARTEVSSTGSGATVRCDVCFRGCELAPGATGACRARTNEGGRVVANSYGRVTSIAVDPIEKKPIAEWMRGSTVLSLGSYGCNLFCPWCQNAQISQVGQDDVPWRELPPEELSVLARRLHGEDPRMIGVAYTYNEPLVSYEYVRDCARLVRGAGLKNVLVSAGCVSEHVVCEVAPLLDAANIDLKSFSEESYRMMGGDLSMAKRTVEILAAEPGCHLEVTVLVVPGVNDTDAEMAAIASWLAEVDREIVLHVSRFHPAYRMLDRGPTPVRRVYELAELARRSLPRVYTGNC